MKRKERILFILSLIVVSCAQDAVETLVTLDLPRELQVVPSRVQRLAEKSTRMVVRAHSANGVVREYAARFSPLVRLRLNGVMAGDRLEVEVWDRTDDGHARLFPCLIGEAAVTGKKRQWVSLVLRVDPAEYDG